ncbi:MAG TPA: hypothetical protein VK919_00850 [Solirubrobacterales bacterium]|nr:hypothetical protein [Solirubrobacterales bacterium]
MAGAATDLVVVVRSGPDTAGARRALALCSARTARGEPTTVVLLDEAVRLAPDAAAIGAPALCLSDDAAMRGMAPERLRQVRVARYTELVDVLMSGARVIGAL